MKNAHMMSLALMENVTRPMSFDSVLVDRAAGPGVAAAGDPVELDGGIGGHA